MRFWRSRRGAVVVAVLLLLALFLVRPGANRLRSQVVRSISLALGRPVEVSYVKLRLFPRPGFDLENFVVHDDPEFSAEPVVRAQEVSAYLRLTSLFRGRVEISSLSLTEPSFNLVQNTNGHWNLEELLDRASKNAVAPTGKASLEQRPAFPYIESDSGRINLKIGAEKTPYALTDADFAIWQDSDNTWGMRLKAKPIRTDFNLSDTGLLRVEGTWQRASELRETPLQFTARWQGGQLGQASKLAYGTDRGWRGTIDVSSTLSGTPGDLLLQANLSVDDFRHFSVVGGDDMRLQGRCSAHYSSVDHVISRLLCNAPMGNGVTLVMDGTISKPTGPRTYDLSVTAAEVPMRSLVWLLRRAKAGVPAEFAVDGQVNGKFRISKESSDGTAMVQGSGNASGLQFSQTAGNPLSLEKVPFEIGSTQNQPAQSRRRAVTKGFPWDGAQLNIGPIATLSGKSEPLLVRGTVSRQGYSISMQGDADLQKLLAMIRTVGLPAPQPQAEGTAKMALVVANDWSGTSAPAALGKVQIHSVRAEVRGVNQPININVATILFKPERVDVQDLRATVGGSTVTGIISLPRHCAVPSGCPTTFDLRADVVDLDKLNLALNPHARPEPWYRFLSSGSPGSPYLLGLYAKGTISAKQFKIRKFEAERMSAIAEMKDGKLRLSDLEADLWNGKEVGDWTADFKAKPPRYGGTGTVQHASLNPLAQAMSDDWITGWANATYRVAASGLSAADLFSSASGTLQVDARDGSLPHIVLAESEGPVQMKRLSARLVLEDRRLSLEGGELETAAAQYGFTGTASWDRVLDLKLTRDGAPAFNITGTLTEPRVAQASPSEAQVALKP